MYLDAQMTINMYFHQKSVLLEKSFERTIKLDNESR